MAAERCTCGSTDLFSGYFDGDGYAVSLNIGDATPEGVNYETHCNDCGANVKTRTRSKLSASAVSRALADAGHRPLPSGTTRMREGIRVTRGPKIGAIGRVTATADFDSDRRAIEVAEWIEETLQDAGYSTDRRGRFVHVTAHAS